MKYGKSILTVLCLILIALILPTSCLELQFKKPIAVLSQAIGLSRDLQFAGIIHNTKYLYNLPEGKGIVHVDIEKKKVNLVISGWSGAYAIGDLIFGEDVADYLYVINIKTKEYKVIAYKGIALSSILAIEKKTSLPVHLLVRNLISPSTGGEYNIYIAVFNGSLVLLHKLPEIAKGSAYNIYCQIIDGKIALLNLTHIKTEIDTQKGVEVYYYDVYLKIYNTAGTLLDKVKVGTWIGVNETVPSYIPFPASPFRWCEIVYFDGVHVIGFIASTYTKKSIVFMYDRETGKLYTTKEINALLDIGNDVILGLPLNYVTLCKRGIVFVDDVNGTLWLYYPPVDIKELSVRVDPTPEPAYGGSVWGLHLATCLDYDDNLILAFNKSEVGIVDPQNLTMVKFSLGGKPLYRYYDWESNVLYTDYKIYKLEFIKAEPETKIPRVAFEGTLYISYSGVNLGHSLLIKLPLNYYYFTRFKLTISKLFTHEVRTSLIPEYLRKYYIEGDVKKIHKGWFAVHSEGGAIEKFKYVYPTKNTLLLSAWGRIDTTPFFGTGFTSYACVINVPLRTPVVALYNNITVIPKVAVSELLLTYDPWTSELKGAVMLTFGTGIPYHALLGIVNLAKTHFVSFSATVFGMAGEVLAEQMMTLPVKTLSVAYWKILGAVFTFDVSYLVLSELKVIPEPYRVGLKDYIFIMYIPVIVDSATGDKYTVVRIYVPEEFKDYEMLEKCVVETAKTLGIENVIYYYPPKCKTWTEYYKVLKTGKLPPYNIVTDVMEYLVAERGIPAERLKITSVYITVLHIVQGKITLLQWFGGGVPFKTGLQINVVSIDAVGTMKKQVIKDPVKILNIIPRIKISGVIEQVNIPYEVTVVGRATSTGVVYDVDLPFLKDVEISFGNMTGFLADIMLEADTVIKVPLKEFDYGYRCSLHFPLKNTVMRIRSVKILDVEKPAIWIERVYSFEEGTFRHLVYIAEGYEKLFKDILGYELWRRYGNMFEFNGSYTINETAYYVYISRTRTKWLDPVNGGTLQYCKNYTFIIYTVLPPNAGLKIYFNGTSVTATAPRHFSIYVYSNVEQDVTVEWRVSLRYFNETKMDWIDVKSWSNITKVHVVNSTFVIVDMGNYIAEAQQMYQVVQRPVELLCEAWVVDASVGNYLKSDDYDKKSFPLLLTVVPPVGENATLYVRVVDAVTNTGIEGATVKVWSRPDRADLRTFTTNETGWTPPIQVVTMRTWYVEASKSGYRTGYGAIFMNETVDWLYVYLVPENVTVQPPPEGSNATYPTIVLPNGTVLYALAIQVVWKDGKPFHGAEVKVYHDNTLIRQGITNGTGFVVFWLQANRTYVVNVHAVNPHNTTQVFDENRTVYLDRCIWLEFYLPWYSYVMPAKLIVQVVNALNYSPVPSALVIVEKTRGGYKVSNYTDASGVATFGLWSGYWYNVSVYKQGFYNVTDWQIYLFNKTMTLRIYLVPKVVANQSITFVPPPAGSNWTHPPYPIHFANCTYMWVLAVQVIYNDTAPYEGALVNVTDLTRGVSTVTRTNGTGFAYFYIRNCSTVKVFVQAGEYNWTRTLHMDKCYWLVFVVPKNSPLYTPEVAVLECHIWRHMGLGYYFGNISHLVTVLFWTNTPQNITYVLELWNCTAEGKPLNLLGNITETIYLWRGMNPIWKWFSINMTEGGYVRAHVKIVKYMNDTDPRNNELWSEVEKIRGFVDIRVFVVIEPVSQRVKGAILPEDAIKVCVGIVSPTRVLETLTKIDIVVSKYGIAPKPRKIGIFKKMLDLNITKRGIYWLNYTIKVPWTPYLYVFVNASNPLDLVAGNEVVNYTLYIDRDFELVKVIKPPPRVVTSNSYITVKAIVRTNEIHGLANLYVSFINATLSKTDFKLGTSEYYTVTVTAKVPPNDLWIKFPPIERARQDRVVEVGIGVTDLDPRNDSKRYIVTVVSTGFALAMAFIGLLAIVVILLIIGIIVALSKKQATIRRVRYL
ncbi:MAG: hypothetical protein DRJ40_08100 [Thermoprotei archaeon]|nr:MAG: hypothetical protein DRJ40_08100 [Thermoprotei archaeon]